MMAALYAMGITLHEHLIIGDKYHSMADRGDLVRIRQRLDAMRWR